MVQKTNEKSLAVVDNSVFAKMRRFFINLFGKKEDKCEYYDEIEECEEVEKEPIKKTQKLFNYDAEVDDCMLDNVTENMPGEENGLGENVDNEIIDDSSEITKKSSVCEEKEELERKLMNYYESIRKK